MDYSAGHNGIWRSTTYTSPYYCSPPRLDSGSDADRDVRIAELQKGIREQRILLSALQDEDSAGQHESRISVEELKTRIRSLSRDIRPSRSGSSNTRYELNKRQLDNLLDESQTIKKEIDYLINTGIKTVCDALDQETNRLQRAKAELAQKQALVSGHFPASQSECERVQTEDQYMIASLEMDSGSCTSAFSLDGLKNCEDVEKQEKDVIDEITHLRQKAQLIMDVDLPAPDHDRMHTTERERQMFEKGLFIAAPVARFIDSLERNNDDIYQSRSTYEPKTYSSSLSISRSLPLSATQKPPPVPISQRPDSPRSPEDIKAEAHRRIEQRRAMFMSKYNQHRSTEDFRRLSPETKSTDTTKQDEKEAQDRLRRAEAEARERLQNQRDLRAKARKEAEEKRKQAEAAREAELKERERLKKLEEEEQRKADEEARRKEQAIAEKRRKEEEEARERRRREIEEHERKERELALKREQDQKIAEEQRQRRARIAAEQAAREKRLLQEELERKEREVEAARQEAERRRQERLYAEKKAKEAAIVEQEEKERLEAEERRLNEIKEEERQRQKDAAEVGVDAYAATAGTTYGADLEDEVDFTTTYRVKALYEYRGTREDDLSVEEEDIIKAHPHKESNSDWWYGTSMRTKQAGFFPRTYVEIIERDDDLGLVENEIIIVQPFQDDDSDWWYGTSEDSGEAGYFPRTYVEIIQSGKSFGLCGLIPKSPTVSHSIIQSEPQKAISAGMRPTIREDDRSKNLSAPNTPVIKKETLTANKSEMARRRRAASNAGISGPPNSTPINRKRSLSVPSQTSRPGSPILITWASAIDEHELAAISLEERKRQEAIFELISTEKTYLRDLQLIINVFYTDSARYLERDEQDVIFSNIEDLLLCNTALLSDLESRQRDDGNFADNLKCYSTYCRNQSFASKLLQDKRHQDQWFDVFLKTAQSRPECRSLDFSHFLLEPMQRITRYPLLLHNILNATPKQHPDYGFLRAALNKAELTLEHVNEETRRYENNQKIDELSRILDMEGHGRLNVPGREFVMEGILYKAKSGRKLHGYLFNDILVLTEPLRGLSAQGYLHRLYREPLDLSAVSIRQHLHQNISIKAPFTGGGADDAGFQVVHGNQVIAVKASSVSQKRQWISQIQHYSALKSTMQRRLSWGNV
ncbi:hypothetical protein BX666DRAFT_1849334 [Dichotomocladium elegans]|nr:hypothetical protein BX666DRAFT_1849334 [Dichotomocladium elegans]